MKRAYLHHPALPGMIDAGGGMSQLSIVEAGAEPNPELSQWFTAPRIARELVGLAADLFTDPRWDRLAFRVLEPSAGRGNLVKAVFEAGPASIQIRAVELDPRWRDDLESLPRTLVHIGDYLTRPAPSRRYDLAVTNPPYDDGEEVHHLAKLIDECERICALLPARSLHGRERYDRVWRRFDPRRADRDWSVWRKVHCVGRPKFGPSGGSDEIVLLDLRRGPGPDVVRWL